MTSLFGKAVGRIANEAIPIIDIDGVMRQIDIDQLIDRIDINKILDKTDLNRALERVDFDQLLSRIDVNAIVVRSDLGAIIASSMAGIFTEILDTIRKQIVIFDIWIYQLARYITCQNHRLLPPGPAGKAKKDPEPPIPQGRSSVAVAVQGRYAGLVSRGLAILIDTVLIGFIFGVCMALIGLMFMIVKDEEEIYKFKREDNRYTMLIWGVYWYLYYFTGTLVGRTFGMAIVGIKVVDAKTGRSVAPWKGFVRTILLPAALLFWFLWIFGFVCAFLRHDGRLLHDYLSGTGTIYRWNARNARYRAKIEAYENGFPSSSLSSTDGLNISTIEQPNEKGEDNV